MKFTYIGAVFLVITTGVILLLNHPKNKSIRWVSVTAFCTIFEAGNLVITKFLNHSFLYDHNPDQVSVLLSLAGTLNSIAFFFFPYCFLMFSITFNGNYLKISADFQKKIHLATLIPILLMYLLFPVTDFTTFNNYRISHTFLAIWGGLYLLIGNILFVYSYFIAKNYKERKEIAHVNIFVLPTTTIVLIVSYLLIGLKNTALFEYRIIAIIYAFIIFIFYIMKEGLFGVRLRFEKYRLDSMMQVVTSGTSMLNHAIKNEIMNISLSANLASQSPAAQNDRVLSDSLNQIAKSAQNIITLVTRFNENFKEIILNESIHNLIDLVKQSLSGLANCISAKKIQVTTDFPDKTPYLMCDSVHIQAVIKNVIKNAVEAMESNGILDIQIYQNHDWLILAIKDNGVGIPKENLSRVLDPFFTTKNLNHNFGLGLTYCYTVMQKHGGTLDIHSAEHEGTTVFLNFPPEKVVT